MRSTLPVSFVLAVVFAGACVDYGETPDPEPAEGVDAGTPDSQAACAEGDVDERSCADGIQHRSCESGLWTTWGPCITLCEAGAVQEEECLDGRGSRSRHCIEEEWGAWSECEVDPDSRWRLALLDAEVPKMTPGGGAWDPFNGAPDPYAVVLVVSGEDGREWQAETAAASDTNEPIWDAVVFDGLAARQIGYLRIEVYDDDGWWNADDFMGACKPFESAPIELSGDVLTCTTQPSSATTLTVRYRFEPVD